MIPVYGDFILEVAPRFSGHKAQRQREIVGEISGQFGSILESYEISTYLRIAHFMGQVTHECAGFCTTEEFASGIAYNGRADLGNTQPGDGPRYKGRGLLQLTGRHNYHKYGSLMNLPLEDKPLMAGEPLISLRISCEYWKDRKINPDCDRDDLISVTKKVNGGLKGIDDRREYYRRAKVALSRQMGLIVASKQSAGQPVVQRGSFGATVTYLQQKLRNNGFNLTIDADFGAATDLAVRQFQASQGLTPDGVVDEKTWSKLG